MRYSNKREDDKWQQYDNTRLEHQSKTINDLQNEIKEYQMRERAFLIHSHLKDKQIGVLKKEIKELAKRHSAKIFDGKKDVYIDHLLLNEFKTLKQILKEKEDKIMSKDDELISLQTNPNNVQFKKLVSKCRDLSKENSELYNYTQGGTLENLKYENGLEKSQIDQLMLKLKEKEIINQEMENELHDLSENINLINKKIKEIEERNFEIDKEIKNKTKY